MMPAMLREEGKLTAEERAQIFRRLWRFLKPYHRRVYWAWALVIVQTLATLAGPFLLRRGIDKGIAKGDLGVVNLTALWYFGATLTTYVAGRAAIMAMARVGESFLRDLRQRIFRHVSHLSLDYF